VSKFPRKPDNSEFNDADLRQMFAIYGQIKKAGIRKNEYGVSKKWGFVEFKTQEEAAKALSAMEKLNTEGKSQVKASMFIYKSDPNYVPRQRGGRGRGGRGGQGDHDFAGHRP
jgi:RNA recognition motif-containing protein